MTMTRGVQRLLIAAFFAILAAIYTVAWLAPSVGLFHDDAVYLVTAKALAAGHGYLIESLPTPIPQTKYPPLFPALLALFVLVSQQAQWLKLLPAACTFGWLALSWKLLRKMGASNFGALLLVGMTAASPTVIFLGTNLLSEPLFALLVAAALLALLDDRAIFAGVFAGLATLTRSAGVALILACILIFVARRRFRSGALFCVAAMVLVAPWMGWSLAHAPHDPYYGVENYASLNILTALPINEKLMVLKDNVLYLLGTPFALLTGIGSLYAVIATLLLGVWCLFRRRQLVPDLFLAIYCLMLLCYTWPPQRFVAPVLPLVLWIFSRALRTIRRHEAVTAGVIILIALSFLADAKRLPAVFRQGEFPIEGHAAEDWHEMQTLFAYVRANTPADTVLLANLDPVFYLNTGRKAIRGFSPDGYKLFHAPSEASSSLTVRPDELMRALSKNGVGFVLLTPDVGFAESPAFHNAVEALERGGILEAVGIPGLAPGYRLLRTVSFTFRE